MSFDTLGLSDKVVAAVRTAGYTTPTPIQEQAIPHVLARRDVLGLAQTGTGKTAGFVLPMLTMLEKGRARARMPRTLILEPTRELAAQVQDNFERYGINHKLTVALLIGAFVWTLLLSIPYLWMFALIALIAASLGLVLTARSTNDWQKAR